MWKQSRLELTPWNVALASRRTSPSYINSLRAPYCLCPLLHWFLRKSHFGQISCNYDQLLPLALTALFGAPTTFCAYQICPNMKLDGRAGVSVAELVIYSPALIVATIICARHGFDRSSGWIFALILCLVRIVGACCQLATYQSQSEGLLEATIILESIGISPLLLATLGLLSRW
jgi:hypothetical protein